MDKILFLKSKLKIMYKRLIYRRNQNLSNESITSVTTLLVEILSIQRVTSDIPPLRRGHINSYVIYLHPYFTILHYTFFSIYFITTLYNFYKVKEKKNFRISSIRLNFIILLIDNFEVVRKKNGLL